jgi:hypothetical protein
VECEVHLAVELVLRWHRARGSGHASRASCLAHVQASQRHSPRATPRRTARPLTHARSASAESLMSLPRWRSWHTSGRSFLHRGLSGCCRARERRLFCTCHLPASGCLATVHFAAALHGQGFLVPDSLCIVMCRPYLDQPNTTSTRAASIIFM